jgi:hypothetical protein
MIVMADRGFRASADNGVAEVTIPAQRNEPIVWIVFGYSATPTGGALTIRKNGETVLAAPITAGGIGEIFPPGFTRRPGETLTVTLAAGGSSVVGYLNVFLKE